MIFPIIISRLPDIWMAVRTPPPFLQFHDEELNQRPLSGTDSYWSAYRDAKDAELSAISRDVNPWKIEVAMGYNRAVRVPILYSGKLILYFKNCSDERYSQNNSNSLQYSLESSLLQQPSEVVPNWRSDDNDDRTQNYNSSFNQPKWIIMFLCLQALLFLSSILLCRLCARTRTQNAFSKLRGQYTALNQIEEECRSLNSESYQGYNFLESNQPTINDDVLVEGRSTTSTSGDEFASNPVKIDFGHYPILGVLLTTLSSSCSSVDQSLDQRQLSSHQLGSGDLTEKEMKKNDQSYGSCI